MGALLAVLRQPANDLWKRDECVTSSAVTLRVCPTSTLSGLVVKPYSASARTWVGEGSVRRYLVHGKCDMHGKCDKRGMSLQPYRASARTWKGDGIPQEGGMLVRCVEVQDEVCGSASSALRNDVCVYEWQVCDTCVIRRRQRKATHQLLCSCAPVIGSCA